MQGKRTCPFREANHLPIHHPYFLQSSKPFFLFVLSNYKQNFQLYHLDRVSFPLQMLLHTKPWLRTFFSIHEKKQRHPEKEKKKEKQNCVLEFSISMRNSVSPLSLIDGHLVVHSPLESKAPRPAILT